MGAQPGLDVWIESIKQGRYASCPGQDGGRAHEEALPSNVVRLRQPGAHRAGRGS